jgi:hypothetical protein
MSKRLLGLVLLVLVCVGGSAGSARPQAAAPAASPAVDVELAFDTTGSMGPALTRARQDAEQILSGVRAVIPGARFAVVAFRDRGNPGGEYQTVQPLTTDSAAITTALGKLKAVHNPSPTNLNVESYNLALHRSFTESGLKWASGSRKIVVVMGDAEGYGGGTAGLPGCVDTHPDPDGLEMRTQLAGMRAAQRTLVMIRQASAATTASLDCYASMAALTYAGGQARDGNASDVVTPLLSLVRGAVAPIAITTGTPLVLPSGNVSMLVKVTNPNAVSLVANDLAVSLPSDFTNITAVPAATSAQRGSLQWTLNRTLAPHGTLTVRVSAKAGAKIRVAQIGGIGHFQLASDATAFASEAATQIHVTQTVQGQVNALTRQGSIHGRVVAALGHPRSLLSDSGHTVSGSFRLLSTNGHAVVLRPTAFHVALRPGNAVLRLAVRVTSVSGIHACRARTSGTLTITDRSYAAPSGKATARLALPSACRPAGSRWSTPAGAIRPLP